jgi:hypothetical protein
LELNQRAKAEKQTIANTFFKQISVEKARAKARIKKRARILKRPLSLRYRCF